jgi:choice-of-anchor C domain-containing protein
MTRQLIPSLLLVAFLLIPTPSLANLLINGSFESGSSPGAFAQLPIGSTAITGWQVTRDNVDYVGTGWYPADGSRSLDLSGTTNGAIAQTFLTTPGQAYYVTFSLAGNPGGGPSVKSLRVTAAGTSADFSFDVSGRSAANMGWIEHTWPFTAMGANTTIEFSSLTTGNAGPTLDNVSVNVGPPPPTPAAVNVAHVSKGANVSSYSSIWPGGSPNDVIGGTASCYVPTCETGTFLFGPGDPDQWFVISLAHAYSLNRITSTQSGGTSDRQVWDLLEILTRNGSGPWTSWGILPGDWNIPVVHTLTMDPPILATEIKCRYGRYSPDWGGGSRVIDVSAFADEHLPPVILLHGYCGNASDWDDLGTYLTAHGFSPHAFNYSPSNGSPTLVVGQLADYLDTNFPNQDVDIIAHSMGGLVARQLIRQRGPNCHIKTLITLGTPHHGVDLLRNATADKAFQEFFSYIPFLNCQLSGQGATDLTPGSHFLNRLNYDTHSQIDKPSGSTRGAHPGEDDYGSGVKVWSIAGTAQFEGYANAFTRWTWGFSYKNDGVVGVDAAVMWRTLDQSRLDTDMGLVPIQHFGPPILYRNDRDFQHAQDLFPILETLLRGGVAPGQPPSPSQLQMMARATTNADSVINLLQTSADILVAGQVTEWQLYLPQTSQAQVVTIADSATFKLRTPNGTLLTPADTLTVTGLQYSGDVSLGLGVYQIANPVAGRWSVVLDPGSKSVDGRYAVSAYAMGATEVSIEATPSYVYGSSTHLRASLLKSRMPTPGVTWTTSALKPDSTDGTVMLYDDGVHGDSLANDGIYGADLNVGGLLGVYSVTATATDPSDSVSYMGSTTVEAAEFKDLAVDSTLSFTLNSITAGDSLYVSGTVRNLGTSAVNNLAVELWDNHKKLDTQTLSLAGGQLSNVAFLWHAVAPDTHLVEVIANPFVIPDEAKYDNNAAGHQVVLGQPIVGVEDGLGRGPGLFLAPPVPNPSTGQTLLRFSLPASGQANLVIYDILGRRIQDWHWQNLPAGPHQMVWNGRNRDGQSVAPGVLFYRLETAGQIRKQKMIRLH